MKRKSRQMLSLMLTTILLLTLLPSAAAAESTVWDGTLSQPSGEGTPTSHYIIDTAEELAWFANEVNTGTGTLYYADLADDIVLNDISGLADWASAAPANEWTPIGSSTTMKSIIFDGCGYTVRGVYIDSTDSYQGLFGYLGKNTSGKYSSISNLSLEASYIEGYDNVGGICGYLYQSNIISGCSSGAKVVGTGQYTGGIAGFVYNLANVSACDNSGTVSGVMYVGSITGYLSMKANIINCSNTGTVNGADGAGGICGYNGGTVTNVFNTASVNASSYSGGVCGENNGSFSGVYNTGSVTGTLYTGKMCGWNTSGASITYAWFLGDSSDKAVGNNYGAENISYASAGQFTSGEVARLLGADFGQDLGADTYPVFRNNSNAVYKLTYTVDSVEYAVQYYNDGDTISISGIPDPTVDNGYFVSWSELPVNMPGNDLTVSAGFNTDVLSAPVITTATLPGACKGEAYSVSLTATGFGTITYALDGTTPLPGGLTLDSSGVITGVPTETGSFTVKITATNEYGSGEVTLTLLVQIRMVGAGTQSDPYQISTADQMFRFSEIVNSDTSKFYYANLTNDIVLNDTLGWESWGTTPPVNQWIPIGSVPATPFKGVFNGNNHTISGVYLKKTSDYAGFFGSVSGANTAIKNLTLSESYIEGSNFVGGICGYLAGSTTTTVESCINAATVIGSKQVGGICGYTIYNSGVLHCQNSGSMIGTSFVGGIVGQSYGNISGCRNSGIIAATAGATIGVASFGGIFGSSYGAVKNSYNIGSLNCPLAYNVGGVGGTNIGTITNAYNTGYILGAAATGKLCGTSTVNGTLTNCYFTGTDTNAGVGTNKGSGTATVKSTAQFTSGEVAWLLGTAFGQDIGADTYPVFHGDSNAVYKLTYTVNSAEYAAQYYNAGDTISAVGITEPIISGHRFSNWKNLQGTMPGEDITVSAIFQVVSAAINPIAKTFQSVVEGYDQQTAQQFIVTNTGESEITGLSVILSGGTNSAFEISVALSTGSFDTDDTATVSVRPKIGLSADTYTDTLTITGDYGILLTVSLSFTVTPAAVQLAAPTSVAWDGTIPGKATWTAVSNASSYMVRLYKGDTAQGSAVTSIIAAEYDFTSTIATKGTGSYTFTVTAIGDSTSYTNSPISALSAPYNYTGGGGSSDGDSSYTYYTITASADTGGGISPSGSVSVREGNDKTFKVTANEGYEISDVLVDGSSVGKADSYTFEDVSSAHTIKAVFAVLNTDKGTDEYAGYDNPFSDVSDGDWFYDSVRFVNEHGLMNGTSLDKFEPYDSMTRAMIVTVLFRLNGDTGSYANTFSDVPAGEWYENAVAWAAANGITSGVGGDKFAPNTEITREQLALMLYNYAKLEDFDTQGGMTVQEFDDYGNVSSYASEAMAWAVNVGLIQGSGSKLNPQSSATRAEVAAMLQRFIEKVMR